MKSKAFLFLFIMLVAAAIYMAPDDWSEAPTQTMEFDENMSLANSEADWSGVEEFLKSKQIELGESNLPQVLLGHWKRDDGADLYFSPGNLVQLKEGRPNKEMKYWIASLGQDAKSMRIKVIRAESNQAAYMDLNFYSNFEGMNSTRGGDEMIAQGEAARLLTPQSDAGQLEYSHYTYQYVDGKQYP